MHTTLWIAASVLAAAFLAGGLTFILMPKEQYNAVGGANGDWVQDFGQGHIRVIGTFKILGAAGMVIPALLEVATVVVPLSASGLMLLMAGAATTRFRRSEWKYLVGDLVFLSLFAFVAWGRFSLEPFA